MGMGIQLQHRLGHVNSSVAGFAQSWNHLPGKRRRIYAKDAKSKLDFFGLDVGMLDMDGPQIGVLK
jgi:hypothetical protein